jgi:hypothetical protein
LDYVTHYGSIVFADTKVIVMEHGAARNDAPQFAACGLFDGLWIASEIDSMSTTRKGQCVRMEWGTLPGKLDRYNGR